ncbi:tify domain-containing protein/CCT_2 domain-containing protein [Cephalotus follicularis]|uniref:Protein TIFY n=1 Tax=Cephalotus follicularis TaxID=3775 RepID=A0A1Q3BFE3_CEPFO|nr:tify domain-containing protein/CCT_2 domain-containing protein [Cephalotus follicularis]
MERDFMGLKLKETLPVVKEEVINDGCKDLGSGMPWPYLNKVSALPHLMSLKVARDNRTKKIVTDPLVSSGLLSISTADAFNFSHKRSTADTQALNHNRQGGTHFSVTAFPLTNDVNSVHRPHDVKLFPVTNQAIPVSVGNPFLNNHFATSGLNLTATTAKRQLLGGIPVTTSHSTLPNVGSVGLVTEQCVKAFGSPGQLTIFYAGTVHVYDDISPEKAHAIMLLASNGSPNTSHPRVQVQVPTSKLSAGDCIAANQPMNKPPCSSISSPLSVSSQTGAQSGSGSTSTDEPMVAKTTGVANPVCKMDPPSIVNSMGSIAAKAMIPSAVPQARKASLARFLEKRKERVMNVAPYNLSQISQECGTQKPTA